MAGIEKRRHKFTIATNTSGFSQAGKSFKEMADICKQSGFIGIEGCVPLFENKSFKDLENIGRLFRERGLCIDTFHLPYVDPVKDDIATLYETDRVKVENRMKEWIDKAAIIGSSIGVVHPTTRKGYNVDIEGTGRILRQLGRTLEAMLKHAEQYNFSIALENMLPYSGGRFGCKVEHLEKILKDYDHPNLGFCFDSGHALVSAGENALDIFHFMKGKLIAFHLADNAGDRDSHLAPGHGRFCWADFFREVEKIDFNKTICVEAPPFSYGPDYSVEAWKTMYGELGKLVDEAILS